MLEVFIFLVYIYSRFWTWRVKKREKFDFEFISHTFRGCFKGNQIVTVKFWTNFITVRIRIVSSSYAPPSTPKFCTFFPTKQFYISMRYFQCETVTSHHFSSEARSSIKTIVTRCITIDNSNFIISLANRITKIVFRVRLTLSGNLIVFCNSIHLKFVAKQTDV